MVKVPNMFELLGGKAPGLPAGDLRKFLQGGGARNQYVQIGPYNSYLRKSVPRRVSASEGELGNPLDLANIQRTDVEGQVERKPARERNPKGKFRELLALLETEAAAAGHDSVYVEQILNEFLPDVLRSAGYQMDELHGMMNPDTPSMYKRLRRP